MLLLTAEEKNFNPAAMMSAQRLFMSQDGENLMSLINLQGENVQSNPESLKYKNKNKNKNISVGRQQSAV